MYEIRQASTADIPHIIQIAYNTWPKAYGQIISAEQIDYMLRLFYSESSLRKQMNEDGHRFLLSSRDGIVTGFASYSLKSPETAGRYRLHKLYVLPSEQGKGNGAALLQALESDIKSRNAQVLELNVNRHNKAKDFYERLGFHVAREEDIDIGNGYWMNDYVMERRF